MQDLNDLFFVAQVVEKGGFAAASRALGIPKSRLSRRIAGLEDRLGVRLIQRSTRRFAVTEIGRIYHRHCQAMIAEAEAAQAIIDKAQSEPAGLVRVSAPVLLCQTVLSRIVPEFLVAYPKIRVMIHRTNRPVANGTT